MSGILVGVPIFALHIESVLWRTLWVILGTGLLIMSFAWSLTYMYSGAIEPAEELSDICGKSLNHMYANVFSIHFSPSCLPFMNIKRLLQGVL